MRASPFFIFYVFVLLAVTLRWNWRGALGCAGMLIFMLLILSWKAAPNFRQLIGHPDFELNATVMRLIFLFVAGGTLAFFGAIREQNHDRLAKLSEWPGPTAATSDEDDHTPLTAILPHVAAVIEAPRILVLWEQLEEPYTNVFLWSRERKQQDRRLGDGFAEWVAPELAYTNFACNDLAEKRFIVAEGFSASPAPLISPALEQEFGIKGVATAAFLGRICRGRLFLLDRSDWNQELLLLTEIVASRIGIELEHYTLRMERSETAAARERIRVARDLHDGILQSLTAAGLQLRAAALGMNGEDREMLEHIRQLLLEEQRRIRMFVEGHRSSNFAELSGLRAEIQELIGKLKRVWNCEVELTVSPEDARIGRALSDPLDFLVAESIANAVQHGDASRVDVSAKLSPDRLLLRIADNGRGLPGVIGVYRDGELASHKIGPVSLRNRVADLKGSLTLSTSSAGVVLQISMPLAVS